MRPTGKPVLILAGAALAWQPVMAAAQDRVANCLTEGQVGAMVVYAMPHAMRAFGTACSAELEPDGFMATGGRDMASRYAEHGDEAWPQALSALSLFAGGGDAAMLAGLPEDVVRPLVDELAAQKVREGIKLEDCGKIERVLEAFAPIEPHEAGHLLAAIASLAGVDDPAICPADVP